MSIPVQPSPCLQVLGETLSQAWFRLRWDRNPFFLIARAECAIVDCLFGDYLQNKIYENWFVAAYIPTNLVLVSPACSIIYDGVLKNALIKWWHFCLMIKYESAPQRNVRNSLPLSAKQTDRTGLVGFGALKCYRRIAQKKTKRGLAWFLACPQELMIV